MSAGNHNARCLNVLVTGLGKTGTTGLFYDLAASHHFEHQMFEPKKPPPEKYLAAGLLVKSLRVQAATGYSVAFDKTILMVRNPVDRLISYLMFAPGGPRHFSDNSNARLYLGRLRDVRLKKRPFIDLLGAYESISGHSPLREDLSALIDAHRSGRFFSLRYEDYVSGRHRQLNTYLGLELTAGKAPKEHSRVARTKAHGEWKLWLGRDDVELFNEAFKEFNEVFDYKLKSSELSDAKPGAEFAEKYTLGVINNYRRNFHLPLVDEDDFRGGVHFDKAVMALRRADPSRALEEIERAIAMDSRPEGYHRLKKRIEKRLSSPNRSG